MENQEQKIVATPQMTSVSAITQNPAVVKRFSDILGKKSAGFISSLVSLSKTPALAKAEPNTIVASALVAATLDLPIVPTLGFAAIVPFYDSKKRQTLASFQVMTKGLIQLSQRSGQYKTINVAAVYDGDIKSYNRFTGEIEFNTDNNPDLTKSPIGYVAYMSLTNGFEKYFYMTIDELKNHGLRYSQTFRKGYGLWKDNFDAMAKKGLALDTLIPTPNGFTTMKDIKVGDVVYNALGEETTVIAKSEVKHLPCYEVVFQNGDSFVCDHEHRWFCKGHNSSSDRDEEWKVLETKDLFSVKSLGYSVITPKTPSVIMKEQNLLVDPYILGYWLGNGSHKATNVACHEDDADEIAAQFEKFYNVEQRHDERNKCVILNISSKTGLRSDNSSLKQQIKVLGVYGNKHIPMIYKRASYNQRLALLQGLCDSDGCIDKQRGRCSFTSVKQGLAEDVYELLSSMGERASLSSGITRGYGTTCTYFTVIWTPKVNPFRLKRKSERYHDRVVITNNSIKEIRKVDSVPTQCIAVDSGDAIEENDLRKSYLIGTGFYPTHNTVLKLLLSKFGPLSVDTQMTLALQADQAAIRMESISDTEIADATMEYVDNVDEVVVDEETTKKVAEKFDGFNDDFLQPQK